MTPEQIKQVIEGGKSGKHRHRTAPKQLWTFLRQNKVV
jgi:hypothetical protein